MKRRTTAPVTALVLCTLLLSGCGSSGDDPSSAASEDPVEGGTLTWAIATEPTAGGVDPLIATSVPAQLVNDLAYDTLFTRDDEGNLQPGLALSWEQPDELTLVVTLRDDVLFADGTPFTADDVVYTFDSYREASTSKRAYLVSVASVEATADDEVTFHFTTPDGTFLNALSGSQTFFIVGEEGYGSASAEERERRTFGTGAFQVTDWKDGTQMVLTRNEERAEGERAYLDEIVFEVIPDESTRLAALQQGTAQIASFGDGALAAQAEQSGFTLGDVASTQNVTIYANPTSGPLSDIRVRQAISLAMDRQALVDTAMLGYAAVSFLPPSGDPQAPAIDAETPLHTRDVDRARELLAETDDPEPEITLTYMGDAATSQHPVYELMQQQLAEAGIQLNLQAKPLSEISPTFTAGESFDGLIAIPGSPKADPLYYFDPLLSPAGSFNYWDGNPDADEARALWEQARATTDPEAYAEVISALRDEVAEQALVFVPISVPVQFEVWDENLLHGYHSDPYYSREALTSSWVTAP